jgi:hypothetical protein
VEVRSSGGLLKSSGAGVVLDVRGRILTNRHVIEAKLMTESSSINVCVTQDEGTAPNCLFHAKVLDSRIDPQDLALLQITEVSDKKQGWITLDEYRLRYGAPSFLKHVNLDKSVTKTEPLTLGQDLQFLGYPGTATDTVFYATGIVSGFQKNTYQGSLAPWYVKTDQDVKLSGTGGGAFDKNNQFIGIPTKTYAKVGYILGRPVINRFLKEVLGADYASSSADALPPNSAVGVFAGVLQTSNCPLYASKGTTGGACACHAGFFAVGDSCIVAPTYCAIKGGTYAYDGQACTGIVESVPPVVTVPVKPTTTTVTVAPKPTVTTTGPIDQTKDAFVTSQITLLKPMNAALVERLRGAILLQTQGHGEAWYLDPVTAKRHYMKDGPTAYQMLRAFGLGIADTDLAKVKAGDKIMVDRMKGRILLQVQAHGEAYYIHPVTGMAYYLKDGEAAYKVMREVSLGIADADLQTIPIQRFVAKK